MTAETRVDLHVKVLDELVVASAKRRGLDAIVYAPHFTRWPTIRKRAAAFSDEELLVVPGRELFTGSWRDRRHVLALDLERPVPDFLTLAGTMDALAAQDAVVLVPHPTFATVSLEREHVGTYADLVDAIEVYNPKYLPWHTRRARSLADEFGLSPFASSYAHLRGTVGEAWTAFTDHIATEADLLAALRDGTERRIEHRQGPDHVRRRAVEIGHLFWENTVEKADRLFLSGTEATHPAHVAYGGEFDDVRVY